MCDASVGDTGKLLDGFSIKTGQRITGWCGATKRSSVNSDATLDLAQLAEMFEPALRSTLCVPLLSDDRLLGVLTSYSTRESPFNESHSDVAEQVASKLAERLVALVSSSPSAIVAFTSRPKTTS